MSSLWSFCLFFVFIFVFSNGKCSALTKIDPYLIVYPSKEVKLNEGESAVLKCEIQLADSALDLTPKLEYLHWKCLSNQQQCNKVIHDPIRSVMKLLIQNATVDMSGDYVCVYIGDGLALKSSVRVIVQSLEEVKLSIFPNETKKIIQITEGESIRINCTINKFISPQLRPYWSKQDNSSLEQEEVSNTSTTLVIQNAKASNAGQYKCVLNIMVKSIAKFLLIRVQDHGKECIDSQFPCERHTGKHCIFHRYRCDGNEDCINGEDEKDCAVNKCKSNFQCQDGRCIDRSLVCDEHHMNDCGDWSDEFCIFSSDGSKTQQELKRYNESIVDNDITANSVPLEDISWLKTTGYTIIACTISVVFFISVIVIIVFKKRMNRQRALRRQRNDILNNNPTNSNLFSRHSHTLEQLLAENEPFLNTSSFGNIIVNVNNGIQYVPGPNFTIMDAPPSYSEVEREIQNFSLDPPPEYSTIDRNPVRNIPQHRPHTHVHRNRRHERGHRSRHIRTSDINRSRPQMQHASVQTSRSQTAQSHYSRSSGQVRSNLTSTANNGCCDGRREYQENSPKHRNLLVQEGKIFLSNLNECSRLSGQYRARYVNPSSNHGHLHTDEVEVGNFENSVSNDPNQNDLRQSVAIGQRRDGHNCQPRDSLPHQNASLQNTGMFSNMSRRCDSVGDCDSLEERPSRSNFRNRFQSANTDSEASLTTNLPNSDPDSCDNYSTITTCNLSMVCQPPSSPACTRTSFNELNEPLSPMFTVDSESSLQVEIENISEIDIYQRVSSASSVESIGCATERHPELAMLESSVLLTNSREQNIQRNSGLQIGQSSLCRSGDSDDSEVGNDSEVENDFLLNISSSELNIHDEEPLQILCSENLALSEPAMCEEMQKGVTEHKDSSSSLKDLVSRRASVCSISQSDRGLDSSAKDLNAGVKILDSSDPVLDTCGTNLDSSVTIFDSSGTVLDSSGTVLDSSDTVLDSSGTVLGSSVMVLDSSDTNSDSSDTVLTSNDIVVDSIDTVDAESCSSNTTPGACGAEQEDTDG